MDQQQMNKAIQNLKKEHDQKKQQSIPEAQSESNVYEDDFDVGDAAIINAIKDANKISPSQQKPKLQPQQRPHAQSAKNVRNTSIPKKKPYQFNKLSEGEKEKIFLDIYDENLKLKENQTKFEKMYGTMEVKLHQMQRLVGNKQGLNDGDNTQLVSKVNNLETENEKLKQKIMAISQSQKIVVVPSKKKKLISAEIATQEQTTGIRGAQFVDQQNQIKQLLELNDKLKKRLIEQEAQFRQLQAMMNSKVVNQSELNQKNAQFITLQERCNRLETQLTGMRSQLEDERNRQSEIIKFLNQEKEKNYLLEGQIRSMELAQNSVNDLQAELQEARRQKKEIEDRLAILMESPFFKEYNERATIQAKLKSLEQEQIRNQTDLKNLRELNVKLETENRIKKEDLENFKKEIANLQQQNQEFQIKIAEKDQQLLPFKDLNYWDNDQFLRVLGNLKWTGEDPAWRKIDFIDRTYLDSDDPQALRKEIEHLKLEKGELAAHLEKTQTLLKTQQDIQDEKDKMYATQIEQLKLELQVSNKKAAEYAKIADLKTQAKQQQTLYEAEGVKYDDSVSVFSVDRDELLQPGENYFDLWIGKGEFQSAELSSSYKTQTQLNLDLTSLLTFLTIDFFDHETQHTSVAEGVSCYYNLQISFKIDADAGFIQFLESNYVKLELYVSQGSEPTKIGTGLVQLKDLVYQNQSDTISKVITGSLTFYGMNSQMIGIVEYKARMRYPISNFIRLLKERNQLQLQELEEVEEFVAVRKRKLVICIEKGTKFPQKANSFVYYNFDTKDYHTNTQQGSEPRWDYRMIHEIVYNELAIQQFKKIPLEFYIIDDNMPLVEGSNDKIGMCLVNLQSLVANEMIDLAAEIINDDGDRVASLFIKIFWYEARDVDQINQQKSMIAQSWEENITFKISSEMRSRGLVGITAFRVFDKDQDQIITFEDFANGMKNVLNLKMNQQELQLYYSKLPQPLNQQKFQEFFKLQSNESIMYETGRTQFQDLSQINQLMQQNTLQFQQSQIEQIHNQIYDLFKRKLAYGKSIQDLFQEIDKLKPDGLLTIQELQLYLQQNGLPLQIGQLREFLKFYMDINNDQVINFQEFLNFFNFQPQLSQQQQFSQASFRKISNQRSNELFYDNQQQPIDIAITAILTYGQAKQWTLMQVREHIDENKNSFIDKSEMRKFLIEFGVAKQLKNGEQDLEMIIAFFDSNRDGQISICEFADTLSFYNNNKQIITYQPSNQSIHNYIVGYLISYMSRTNKSIPELFNEIDRDNNGYLTQSELRQLFKQNILIPIDDYELHQLFLEFDANNDGKISIQEFLKIIRPALEQQEKKQTRDARSMSIAKEQLLRKSEEICYKNYKILLLAFQQRQIRQGYINEQNFKQILREQKVGFTNQEIDDLPIYVIKSEAGQINYQEFIDLSKARGQQQQSDLFGQTGRSGFGNLSQLDQERAIGKAKEVFQRIAKATKGKFTQEQLFKTFDIDGNGKVSKTELNQAFNKMQLRIDRQNMDLIFKALDRDNNGSIDISEFLKYIQ